MEHLKADLGYLERGTTVVVTLDTRANVQVMSPSDYRTYSSGRGGRYHYLGGLATSSPVRITIPSSGQWVLVIDLAGRAGTIRHSYRVEGPPRGDLPVYNNTPRVPLADRVSVREPAPPASLDELDGRTWDVFVSHASEDKAAVAIPLAQALQDRGVSAWLDKAELRIGDSLRRRIDQGLRSSRFAVVILSEPYFAKGWPQYELDGIVTLNVNNRQDLLPIWHGVTRDDVAAHSPSLADKLARDTATVSVEEIAEEIADVVLAARRR